MTTRISSFVGFHYLLIILARGILFSSLCVIESEESVMRPNSEVEMPWKGTRSGLRPKQNLARRTLPKAKRMETAIRDLAKWQEALKNDLLEEKLDTLEGFKHTRFEAANLCLFPNIVIPPKFQLPAFNKYRGTTCPKSHLTTYCRKMALHTHDDALLFHFF
ncbi:hypothetical protein CR513_27259, partial [Mucuna pruriens]